MKAEIFVGLGGQPGGVPGCLHWSLSMSVWVEGKCVAVCDISSWCGHETFVEGAIYLRNVLKKEMVDEFNIADGWLHDEWTSQKWSGPKIGDEAVAMLIQYTKAKEEPKRTQQPRLMHF